jgi:hypothetical protein
MKNIFFATAFRGGVGGSKKLQREREEKNY